MAFPIPTLCSIYAILCVRLNNIIVKNNSLTTRNKLKLCIQKEKLKLSKHSLYWI